MIEMNTSSNSTILGSVDYRATMSNDGKNTNFDITCIELCLRDFMFHTKKGFSHEAIYCHIYFQLLQADENGRDGKPDWRARGGTAMSVSIENAFKNTFEAAKAVAVAMVQRIAKEAPHCRLLVPFDFKWSEYEHEIED